VDVLQPHSRVRSRAPVALGLAGLVSLGLVVPGLAVASGLVSQNAVDAQTEGDAEAHVLASSLRGDATCTGVPCVAASGEGSSSSGGASVSGTGNATGSGAAMSGTGDASGRLAAIGAADAASDHVAVSGSGSATGLAAVAAMGDADGGLVAVSPHGDASCEGTTCVAASGEGSASSFSTYAGGTAVSGTGNAYGRVAVSGTGHANGDPIVVVPSPFVPPTGGCAIGREGFIGGCFLYWWQIPIPHDLFPSSIALAALSACDTLAAQGRPEACTDPI